MSASANAAISMVGIGKRFPGVHALKNVSIEIKPGEVVGLIGENGAGKSTLMKILSGVYQPDSGQIFVAGKETRIESAADANRKGIGMVFQEQSLLPNLTIGENIYLGNERQFTKFGLVQWRALYDAAARQLEKVKVDIDPRTRADALSFAARQMVELAKALTLEEHAAGHLVILLDEPTSVLERAEIDILFDRVRALKSRASFVFVSHRLDEVLQISDRVYVMKDGEVVAELAAADADVAMLHRLMVGRTQQADYYYEPLQMPVQDAVVLEADQLACGAAYRNVSFKLRAGEVLGIAGVIGSGREELTRTLAGFAPHTAGTLKVAGREVRLETPAEAVDLGIGYIPRERRVEGLVLFLSVSANITLADLASLTRFGLIDARKERGVATDWTSRLKVRTPNINTLCLGLSGGNQQKVVLAKWLNAKARILVLDHPTRGLDVGAKEEVYELVRRLTGEGLSIVLTSDTLEETIGLSHSVARHARRRDYASGRGCARRKAATDRPHRTYGLAMAVKALRPDDIRKWLPLATLAVLILLVGIAQPSFLQPGTLIELASDTAVLFILATGVTFVIMLGGIDLSIQSMASLASVIVALTVTRLGYGSFLLAIVIGAIAGLPFRDRARAPENPLFHRHARDGRRPLQRGAGDLKGALDHPRRGGARLSGVDHRPGVWLAERYFYRASRSGGSACRAGAYAVRPLQRGDWSGRACGLRIRRQGRPAEDLRLCAFGGVRGAGGCRPCGPPCKRFAHFGC